MTAPDLDFSRRTHRRGAFPDVRRALLIYWQVEALRSEGLSLRGAFRRVAEQEPVRSPQSIQYQWRQGRGFDSALRASWGDAYETLANETGNYFDTDG